MIFVTVGTQDKPFTRLLEAIDKAIERKHMMFSEAAEIAKKADVEEMWLTHFSPSLTNPEDYIEVARNIFDNTKIGKDRMIKVLDYKN